jgi:hypothetical protein
MPVTVSIIELHTIAISEEESVQNAYIKLDDGTDQYNWHRGGIDTSLTESQVQTLLDAEADDLFAAAAAASPQPAPATVVEGEYRFGNGVLPGNGFSGVRIGYPGFTYDGEEWNLVGVESDALQFGVRASDGKALGGGGAVIIDEGGITIEGGTTESNTVKWIDTLSRMIQELRSNVAGTITSGVLSVLRQTEADKSILSIMSGSALGAFGKAVALKLFVDGTTGEASARIYAPMASPINVAVIINEDDTPLEALDVRGNATIEGFVELEDITVPTTPASNKLRLFQDSGMVRFVNDAAIEHQAAVGKPYPQKSVANTTETSIYEYTIPASAMGSNGGIRVPIPYRIANTTGNNQTIRWRLYYDDTVMIDYTTPNIASNASPYEGLAWLELYSAGATSGANAQRAQLRLDLAAAAAVGSAAATGGTYNVTIGGAASEDSTVAKILKLTVTLSAVGGTAPNFRSGTAIPLGPYTL